MLFEALMFTGPVAGVSAIVWASVDRRFRVVRGGVCAKCGYSLAGLPGGSSCPECGAAKNTMLRDLPMTPAHRIVMLLCVAYAAVATTIVTLSAVTALGSNGASGAVFAALCLGSPFVVLAVLPLIIGARVRASVGHLVTAGAMMMCLAIEVAALVMTATGPPDAQAGLVVLGAPFAGALGSGHGMLLGVLIAKCQKVHLVI